MYPVGQRKCSRNQFFIPDPRQRQRQLYCAGVECRRASKAASQQRWLARDQIGVKKKENWLTAAAKACRPSTTVPLCCPKKACDRLRSDPLDTTTINTNRITAVRHRWSLHTALFIQRPVSASLHRTL